MPFIQVKGRWGLERGYVEQNTAKGIKNIRKERNAPRANRPWTDAERYAVLEAASWALKVPIALAMFVGLREGDALAIPHNAYDGSKLDFITSKTGQRVCWPVSSSLKEILDGAPKHEAATLAANSYGQTWTDSGFRGSWEKLRARLEQDSNGQALFARCRSVPEDDRGGRAHGRGGEQTAIRSCQTYPEKCQTLNNRGTTLKAFSLVKSIS